jgi:DNA-binding transcriptional ArsR family regulator
VSRKLSEKLPASPSLEEVDRVFGALAHEARRQVLILLGQRGELPSGYLAARFSHSWPTTTRHLNVLEQAGLVEVRRGGRNSHYRLNRAYLERVVEGWKRHLLPTGPEQRWTSVGPKSTQALAQRPRPGSPKPPQPRHHQAKGARR